MPFFKLTAGPTDGAGMPMPKWAIGDWRAGRRYINSALIPTKQTNTSRTNLHKPKTILALHTTKNGCVVKRKTETAFQQQHIAITLLNMENFYQRHVIPPRFLSNFYTGNL